MIDPVSGVAVVGNVKRLTKQDVAMVRGMMASGQEVVFKDRHQWRHFQRHP